MTSEQPPLRLLPKVLWPGVALLAVGALLYYMQWNTDWEAIRGEWNERGMLVYLGQNAWVPFLALGGALVLAERLWAWPLLRWLAPVIVLVGYWALSPPHRDGPERNHICLGHQRQLALAALMYAQDHRSFPSNWEDLALPPSVLKCHGNDKPGDRWGGYGLNAHITGRPLSILMPDPTKVLLTADSVTPNSLLSTQADIAKRHHGKYVASFGDGHIEILEKDVALEVK